MYLGSIVVEMNTKMVASGVISRDYLFIILCKIQTNPMLSLASRLREEKKKKKKSHCFWFGFSKLQNLNCETHLYCLEKVKNTV